MDFGKMSDQLKEQMNEKIKEELTRKVDEVKADIEKKFGMPSESLQKEAAHDTMQGSESSEPTAESETEESPKLDAAGAAEDAIDEDATSDSMEIADGDEGQKKVA